MKRTIILFIAAILATTFNSCEEDKTSIPTPTITITDQVEVSYESVTITCAVVSNVSIDALSVEYSESRSFADAVSSEMRRDNNGYSVALSALKSNTVYYYRYVVENSISSYTDKETREFITLDYSIPVVTTETATDIFDRKATLTGTVVSDGGSAISAKGFKFGTDQNHLETISVTGAAFAHTMIGLSYETTYYYQAYAITEKGTGKGAIKQFTTGTGLAILGTLSSSNIENASVKMSCEVTSDGGATILSRGFCYATSSGPTINSAIAVVTGSKGSMEKDITGLEPGTTYYFRAFASTECGTVYSNEVQITTKLGLPTMAPVNISNIQPRSAVFASGIVSAGDGYILEKGYCFGTKANPNKDDTIEFVNTSWSVTVTGLKPNTLYHVRAFATTQYGTAYSNDASFTTQDFQSTLVTGVATGTSLTGAALNGTLETDYAEGLSGVWFIYSDSATDIAALKASGTRVSATRAGNNLSANITGLKNYTTYHFITYAIIYDKEFVGNVALFTTAAVDLGLSVKWAGCNVGASTPQGVGNYYAWGETQIKSSYTSSNYKFGASPNLTKYVTSSSSGTVDNKTTLDIEDDAARMEWGGEWRYPTASEMTELRNNCTWLWTSQNAIPGYKITSKVNGNSIFLPAAEGIINATTNYTWGAYWVSNIQVTNNSNAELLYFYKNEGGYNPNCNIDMKYRYYGFPIRPVTN